MSAGSAAKTGPARAIVDNSRCFMDLSLIIGTLVRYSSLGNSTSRYWDLSHGMGN